MKANTLAKKLMFPIVKPKNFAFINATGFTRVLPFDYKNLNLLPVTNFTINAIYDTPYFWSVYFIGTFFNENKEQEISYINFVFNPNVIKYNLVMGLTNQIKIEFVDCHEFNLNSIIWVAIPEDVQLTDDELMEIAVKYNGFKPRG